jgi:hypothetical protein
LAAAFFGAALTVGAFDEAGALVEAGAFAVFLAAERLVIGAFSGSLFGAARVDFGFTLAGAGSGSALIAAFFDETGFSVGGA